MTLSQVTDGEVCLQIWRVAVNGLLNTVAHSPQGVVLQFRGWVGRKKFSPCYEKLPSASELDGFFGKT